MHDQPRGMGVADQPGRNRVTIDVRQRVELTQPWTDAVGVRRHLPQSGRGPQQVVVGVRFGPVVLADELNVPQLAAELLAGPLELIRIEALQPRPVIAVAIPKMATSAKMIFSRIDSETKTRATDRKPIPNR